MKANRQCQVAALAAVCLSAIASGCSNAPVADSHAMQRSVRDEVCPHLIDAINGIAEDRPRAVERSLDRLDTADAGSINVDVDALHDAFDDGDLTIEDLEDAFDDGDCDDDLLDEVAMTPDPTIDTASVNTPLPISVPDTTPSTTTTPPTSSPTTAEAPSTTTTTVETPAPPASPTVEAFAIDLGHGAVTPQVMESGTLLTGLGTADPVSIYQQMGMAPGMPYIVGSAVGSISVSFRTVDYDAPGIRESADITMFTTAPDSEAAVDMIVAALKTDASWSLSVGARTSDNGITTHYATVEPAYYDETRPSYEISAVAASADRPGAVQIRRKITTRGAVNVIPQPVLDASGAAAAIGAVSATITGWSGLYGFNEFSFDGQPIHVTTIDVDGPATSSVDWFGWATQLCEAAGMSVPTVIEVGDEFTRCESADGRSSWFVSSPYDNGQSATATLTIDSEP